MQDVVELKAHGERFAAKEALRNLRVPDKLIGVHRLVAVASAALVVQVGGNARAPGSKDVDAAAIRELPGVEVATALKHVAGVHIVERTVEGNLKPVFSEAALQAFHDACGAGFVLARCLQAVVVEVAHHVVVVDHGEGVHVPHASRVDGGVEHQSQSGVPVAVDVFGPCNGSTRQFVVSHHAGNAIACIAIIGKGHDAALMVYEIGVVVQAQVVAERGFQSGVTLRNAQRIAVVGDVDQVAHLRLRRGAAVVKPQLGDVVGHVAQVEGRGDVEHVAHGVGVKTSIGLHELRFLRLEHHAGVQAVFVANQQEADVHLVDIVFIF